MYAPDVHERLPQLSGRPSTSHQPPTERHSGKRLHKGFRTNYLAIFSVINFFDHIEMKKDSGFFTSFFGKQNHRFSPTVFWACVSNRCSLYPLFLRTARGGAEAWNLKLRCMMRRIFKTICGILGLSSHSVKTWLRRYELRNYLPLRSNSRQLVSHQCTSFVILTNT